MTKSEIRKLDRSFLPSVPNGPKSSIKKTYAFYTKMEGAYEDNRFYIPSALAPADGDGLQRVSVTVTDPTVLTPRTSAEFDNAYVGMLLIF